MEKYIRNKNNNGIISIRQENLNEYDKYFYKQFVKAEESELKKYINSLLIIKAQENNQTIIPNVLNMKEVLLKKENLDQKVQKIRNVIFCNTLGTYFSKIDSIEIYLSNFYKYLNFYTTNQMELSIVRIIYHELQHQLQNNIYKEGIIEKEISLMEKDYQFYRNYHDYFELEIDAEIKSLIRLKKDIEKGEYPIFQNALPLLDNDLEKQYLKRRNVEYRIVQEEVDKIK